MTEPQESTKSVSAKRYSAKRRGASYSRWRKNIIDDLTETRQTRATRRLGGKFAQFLDKVAKTVAKPKKCQNICFKAKFESKDLHQTFLNS
jgi:hypothetical protein